ncbi:MAG: hypothetical protein LLG04_04965 [Parachlamydia sp.]|nr:hypothetical protein [Parachlamydia sp.]
MNFDLTTYTLQGQGGVQGQQMPGVQLAWNTGNVQAVVNHIDAQLNLSIQQKIETILDCLSQALVHTGRYKGKFISELTHRVLQYSVTDAQETQRAITTLSTKFDIHLKDTIENVKSLISIYLPNQHIRLQNFQALPHIALQHIRIDRFFLIPAVQPNALPQIPQPINILEIGDITALSEYLDSHNAPNPLKLYIFLSCLAQSLSDTKLPQRSNCESQLKNKIYHLTKLNPQAAGMCCEHILFNENSQLQPVIKTIEYMTKTWHAKTWHHFKDTYSKNRNYFMAGFQLALVGGLIIAISTPNHTSFDRNKKIVAWSITAMAICGIMLPLFESFILSFSEKP